MDKIKILILAANAWKDKRLDLGVEQDEIQDLWNTFDPSHERFDVCVRPAASGKSLLRFVLGFKPHLIHFSGHGKNNSLVFADISSDYGYEVSKQTLAQLFQSCAPDLKAVFLNACHSAKQADAIVEQVDYLIGMNALINDLAAISFSKGFYTEIFTQTTTTLDIAKAYHAGLAQMAIDKIAETEQAKLTKLERQKTYVSGCKHDIFISFADEDTEWTNKLTVDFCKPLRQKLYPANNFQLCTDNDLEKLDSSAILIIIASPAYYQKYSEQLEKLIRFNDNGSVFFVNYKANNRPDRLNNLRFNYHEFWGNKNSKTFEHDDYNAEVDRLALEVAEQLQKLKNRSESKKRLKDDFQAEENKSASIFASVFLNSAPEDLELTHHIKSLLKKNGVKCVLVPMERSDKISLKERNDDIENRISVCDAVLVLCEQTTAVWASKQIMDCQRLQRKRETPFRIVAIHKGKDQPDLGIDWDLLKTYDCPPKLVEAYLQEFIGALS